MTKSSDEYGAEQTQDDAFFGEPPAGDANPGDYMSNDQQGGVSEDTGTVYDQEGVPEATPHDEAPNEDDPTDPTGPNAGTSAVSDE